MVACGSVLISLTSLCKYYGSVLVACGSMRDLLIFRAIVTPQFSVEFHAAQLSKMPSTQP